METELIRTMAIIILLISTLFFGIGYFSINSINKLNNKIIKNLRYEKSKLFKKIENYKHTIEILKIESHRPVIHKHYTNTTVQRPLIKEIEGLEREWAVLLEKYIYHVLECEGSTFISQINKPGNTIKFNNEQVFTLKAFDIETKNSE